MRCILCGEHATFDHTVFQGTTPTTVRLCDSCTTTTSAQHHLASIRSAPDREAKAAAVGEFLRAIGK